jgi:hypothetical protein
MMAAHFGRVLTHCTGCRCWEEVVAMADLDKAQRAGNCPSMQSRQVYFPSLQVRNVMLSAGVVQIDI